MLGRILFLFIFTSSLALAAPELSAPASAKIGSEVAVSVIGTSNQRDFVAIVPVGSPEGAYDAYQYVNKPGGLNAAGLNEAMARALPAFEIVDAKGQVIAEGLVDDQVVRVPAGNFNVHIKGRSGKPVAIVVKQKETTSVQL